MKICRNVKICREWKRFTPEQVALKAGIDLKRYKKIERAAVSDITFDEAFRIGMALKLYGDDIENLIHF